MKNRLKVFDTEGDMTIKVTQEDTHIKGSQVTGENVTLEAKKDMTENSDNYIRTYLKTETANTMTAGKDISLISGNDIKARSTTVASENGQVSMKAANCKC